METERHTLPGHIASALVPVRPQVSLRIVRQAVWAVDGHEGSRGSWGRFWRPEH